MCFQRIENHAHKLKTSKLHDRLQEIVQNEQQKDRAGNWGRQAGCRRPEGGWRGRHVRAGSQMLFACGVQHIVGAHYISYSDIGRESIHGLDTHLNN